MMTASTVDHMALAQASNWPISRDYRVPTERRTANYYFYRFSGHAVFTCLNYTVNLQRIAVQISIAARKKVRSEKNPSQTFNSVGWKVRRSEVCIPWAYEEARETFLKSYDWE
jgi:hypothetical protein